MKRETTRPQKIVWVIDDDETTLLLAQTVLTDSGFQARTFTNGSEALAAMETGVPDIIVADVIMPGMDGFEFCVRLRSLPGGVLVPVLVTTSLDDTVSIEKAYRAGATDFAVKPLNWALEIHRLDYLMRSAGFARDVQQKERETRLAKEEWERTFNSISDSVTVLDRDLRILRVNQATARFFNTTPETLLGRPCYELFCSDGQKCPGCPVGRVLETELPSSVEIDCTPSGNPFEITVSPITGPQGRVTHLVHVARDLSEKRKLESELRHAQKLEAVGTLAGGIAHDFNNLLTMILCCAEMAITEAAELGRTDENLDTILDAVKRGTALTKQLLLFSRKQPDLSSKRAVDLNEVLRSVGRILEKGLKKSVSQQYRLASDLRHICADRGQIEQVAMNLAVNAAHAMPNGGTLIFETRDVRLDAGFCARHANIEPGDYVLLTVSDTGHGMSKDVQARIYEPFFTTKQVGEGTGLGLSVVFGILREHKGLITCQSDVGAGTTFQIYLPAAQESELKALSSVAERPSVLTGSETILVVDDEASIRGVLERHLAKLGYKVLAAADGANALRIYAESGGHPKAVILDLGMPNMSGWECLEKLRAINPGVKVMVASGYGANDLDRQALNRGAKGFLRKPYDLAGISKRLREILDGKQS
jgi:PAS domain S-box-containing protein